MLHSITCKNDNICLCPMTAAQSELYRQLRNRDEVRCSFVSTDIITEEQQKTWFEKYLSNNKDYMFSILHGQEFVGGCSLYNISDNRCEFGRFIIAPEFSGRGYGKIVLSLVFSIARELEIKTIILSVLANNSKALHLYESMGFYIVESEYKVNGKTMIQMKKSL